MTPDTPVQFSPLYAPWYRATTGNEARHALLEGWYIDSGKTAHWLGADGQQWVALVCYPPLVLLSSLVFCGMCVNVPAKYVQVAGRVERIIQLSLWENTA